MRMVRLPIVRIRRRALLSSCHVSVGVPPRKERGGVALGVCGGQVLRARTSLAHPLQPSSMGGSRDCRPEPLPSSLWTLGNWSALSLQSLPLRRVTARLSRPGDACNWCSSVVHPGLLLDLSCTTAHTGLHASPDNDILHGVIDEHWSAYPTL